MRLISLLILLNFSRPAAANLNFEYSELLSEVKMQQRRACHKADTKDDLHIYSSPDPHNNPHLFLPTDYKYKNIIAMHEADLDYAMLEEAPWSGDYWPYFQGLLGNRIADEEFVVLNNWKEKYDYVQSKPAQQIYKNNLAKEIDRLSVAEKYDLLLGQENFRLTNYMWNQGKQIFDKEGEVEKWMGLCHGWAPTAILNQRPHNKVTMTSFDGQNSLNFYPDEIKALTTYSWAVSQYPTKTAGRRCNEKEPDHDDEDRLTQPECQDLNPATWHIVVVNQIGDMKESFIIDATYSYEVWNQPVFSYVTQYFNRNTGMSTTDINEAIIKVEELEDDKFAKHRAPETRYIVGIDMTLVYVAESIATQAEEDLGQRDNFNVVRYVYDLELDKDHNIIGGEWLSKDHPDFIWKPMPGASANNYFDQYLDIKDVDPSQPLNDWWVEVSEFAAQYGLISNQLVQYIIELSQPKVEDVSN